MYNDESSGTDNGKIMYTSHMRAYYVHTHTHACFCAVCIPNAASKSGEGVMIAPTVRDNTCVVPAVVVFMV